MVDSDVGETLDLVLVWVRKEARLFPKPQSREGEKKKK